MAQMRTDELRELLERYPDLDRRDLRRLRQLYHDASATEVITILSSTDLGPKIDRLDPPSDFAWDVVLTVSAIWVAGVIAFYVMMQPG